MKRTKSVTKPAQTRLELDKEIVSDLEASDEDTEAIRGGANYTRVASIAF